MKGLSAEHKQGVVVYISHFGLGYPDAFVDTPGEDQDFGIAKLVLVGSEL